MVLARGFAPCIMQAHWIGGRTWAMVGSGGSQIEGQIMQTQTLDSKIIPGTK